MNTIPSFLTLVAGTETNGLTNTHLAKVEALLGPFRATPTWLHPDRAIDIPLPAPLEKAQHTALRAVLAPDRIDVFVTPASQRIKKLLLADMDSTIITGETLDDLAATFGVGDKVADITRRAMAGELDFRAALAERLNLIRGLPQQMLDDIRGSLTPSPGAGTLITTLRAHGTTCVLVSGGFTLFTGHIAARLGFDHHHGNHLEVTDGMVAGTLRDPLIDKSAKQALLQQYTHDLGLEPAQTTAIGDGANDLPMLQAAGLGIGYHPKPLLRETLDNLILYADLTALLYAMGIPSDRFVHTP